VAVWLRFLAFKAWEGRNIGPVGRCEGHWYRSVQFLLCYEKKYVPKEMGSDVPHTEPRKEGELPLMSATPEQRGRDDHINILEHYGPRPCDPGRAYCTKQQVKWLKIWVAEYNIHVTLARYPVLPA